MLELRERVVTELYILNTDTGKESPVLKDWRDALHYLLVEGKVPPSEAKQTLKDHWPFARFGQDGSGRSLSSVKKDNP